ncbi:TonB-dependent receptor [Danxiaibacter flavus]|uniref:TonB-dependent receptor n=1 Tax=Danxiaibacter flavus TaxID=3049108 RepID=A0ABV3ZEK2_9BACT|nr:TonB-dependent receptor [Chitinophagaceae bacterium DXS]
MKKVTASRHQIILILLLLSVTSAFSQQTKLSGRVFSSPAKDPVSQATVQLLKKDSTVARSVLTDSTGKFTFSGMAAGPYTLRINALSFTTFDKAVSFKNGNSKVAMDSIFLAPSYDALTSVTIVAKKATVAIKTDTTEFTASAVKVRKNGTVEDVFKKIPGMEVDKNGSIKAQGEPVTKIYVDGKPFFGSDLKSVTQNFPADIIDKIQVIDKRSDQALATNVEDGVREKIINITLKKNRKRGLFGKEYAGYGTDNRYEVKGNVNMFNNERKIAIVAGANNTGRNDNGSSDNASYDNWNGITDNKQLKANYADKFGKTLDFSAWAGYDRNKTVKQQSISRQNIFTDSSTYYDEKNNNTSINNNLYTGIYLEFKPDSLTMVRVNQNAGYNISHYDGASVFNTTLPGGAVKINEGARLSTNKTTVPTSNGQISLNHRFGKTRRNLFMNFWHDINNRQSGSYNQSNNYFTPVDSTAYSLLLNQYQNYQDHGTRLGSSVSYSEPVGRRGVLNFGYNYSYGKNNSPKEVYDYNAQTGYYDHFNDSLSNHFNNFTYNNTASVNYNYNGKNSGFGVGARWQDAKLVSETFGKDTSYKQSYAGFSPNLSYYSNGRRRRFNVYYNFNLQAPQAIQLQPIVDNTNPLYLRLGNPGLKFAQIHNARYTYNYYNSRKETGFNSNASFSAIVDNIVSSNTFDQTTGRQATQPVNMDGAYNWNAWFSYFRPFVFGREKIKWNINLYANASHNINLLNGEENKTNNTYSKVYMGLTYDTPEWIDLHTDVSLVRQTSDYSLQPDLSNTSYFFVVSPNVTFSISGKTEINIDYDYRQTTGQAAGYNTTINMLNADVVQYFSEKKDVWLKLKAYDLLNQNVSIWRSTGDNYIQDTRSNVLSRFLLVSLNFRLNKFNTKQETLDFPGNNKMSREM